MKNLFIIMLLFTNITLIAQSDNVESGVYRWDDVELEKQGTQNVRHILEGTTPDLEVLKVDVLTIQPEVNGNKDSIMDAMEKIIIIKEGQVKFSLDQKQKNLGAGSVVVIMPDEKIEYQNTGTEPATIYIVSFKANKPVNLKRAESSDASSFIIDFENLEFKPHDLGGIRNYYHRSTAMFEYAEMHVTTLNANIKSHELHTHKAAEFVLMISGDTEMQIGNDSYKATTGDLYYLESNVPHAIKNTGNEPCMYYAFQWE